VAAIAFDSCNLSIEDNSQLLERPALCLLEEEDDDKEFDWQPSAVNEVELPADSLHADGVDVGVEEQREVDGEGGDGETLGADVVRHDFGGVEDSERRPSEAVRHTVEEDEDECTSTDAMVALSHRVVRSSEARKTSEGNHHTSSSDDELRATVETVGDECTGVGDDPGHAFLAEVELELLLGVRNADVVENLGEVVRDETVTGPLGEETNADTEEHAVAVARSSDKLEPRDTLVLPFELNSFFDLLHLQVDERVVRVPISVKSAKDCAGLVSTTFVDQPTWRLGHEGEEDEEDGGEESLESGRDTPCRCTLDIERAIGDTGSDDSTQRPLSVVETGDLASVGGMCEFGDEDRCGVGGDTETKADEETGTGEHLDVLGTSLKDDADENDGGPDGYPQLPANLVRDEWRDEDTTRPSRVKDGVEQPELGTDGVVEGCLPLGERLHSVHHGAIVTVDAGVNDGDSREEP